MKQQRNDQLMTYRARIHFDLATHIKGQKVTKSAFVYFKTWESTAVVAGLNFALLELPGQLENYTDQFPKSIAIVRLGTPNESSGLYTGLLNLTETHPRGLISTLDNLTANERRKTWDFQLMDVRYT